MLASASIDRVLERLGESPGASVFWSRAEILAYLNEGQRLFAAMTLCLESTASYQTTGQAFAYLRPAIPDFFLPLRVTNAAGRKVRPARLTDLAAVSDTWPLDQAGEVARYWVGAQLAAFWPVVVETLSIVYVREPAVMMEVSSFELRDDDVTGLEHFSVWRARFKEGGQELAKDLPLLRQFLDGAQKRAEETRIRNTALSLDSMPWERANFDRSFADATKRIQGMAAGRVVAAGGGQ
jgi:hypothetical protein